MDIAHFIADHGLWSDEQRAQAQALKARLEREPLELVRLAWADPHGASRAKAVSPAVFFDALERGYNINVATTTLDSAGARVFSSFTRGGGMGLAEMTGSPNLVIVPDPGTFRILPWASGVGWVLCDEYFRDGRPFHFSPRHLLKRQLARLARENMELVVGLEVEWYLAHLAEDQLSEEHVGIPGVRGRAIRTTPFEPGYSYHSETNMDVMQPVLSELARAYSALGLPLRSIENEWGPGQVECTFSAERALRAADDFLLFRSARRNLFAGKDLLSPLGEAYLAGLLEHAAPATVFATPTVNGYRRFRPNSLAPDRAGWGYDHRGAMVRVLGGRDDPATRLENRLGEPGANPYLFIASQIVTGLDGIERSLKPVPRDDDPYTAERPLLPTHLGQALEALEASALFRRQFGEVFVDYYLKLKRSEFGRYRKWLAEYRVPEAEPTEWEQNEYF